MDKTGPKSCPMASFGIGGIELAVSATRRVIYP
jgi:hypothetical protein